MTEATTTKAPRKTDAADRAKQVYAAYGITASDLRSWAKANDVEVSDRGRIAPAVFDAFVDSQKTTAV